MGSTGAVGRGHGQRAAQRVGGIEGVGVGEGRGGGAAQIVVGRPGGGRLGEGRLNRIEYWFAFPASCAKIAQAS